MHKLRTGLPHQRKTTEDKENVIRDNAAYPLAAREKVPTIDGGDGTCYKH